MSLDQEAINQQLNLLATHRRTLAVLLEQQASLSAAYAPPGIAIGIAEVRANISRIKAYLRENGVPVEDEPNDEAPSTISPTSTEAERKIAEQRELDAVLATYISEIEELLINKNLLKSGTDDGVRKVARVRTVTALQRLEGEHNQKLIQFLQDTGLLRDEQPNRAAFRFRQPTPVTVLRKANLPGADLQGADLQGADLQGANLRDANLQGANLPGANLQGAKLRQANLPKDNLCGADLQGANLRDANLQGANLRDANLRDATLLVGAYLPKDNLRGATMPDGRKYEDWLKDNSE